MIRSVSMCKLQEPPFEMLELSVNIVVSQSVEDILALAPKPKVEKLKKKLTQKPVKIHMLGEKKSKKQTKTPTTGIEVTETLEEAPVK